MSRLSYLVKEARTRGLRWGGGWVKSESFNQVKPRENAFELGGRARSASRVGVQGRLSAARFVPRCFDHVELKAKGQESWLWLAGRRGPFQRRNNDTSSQVTLGRKMLAKSLVIRCATWG